MLFTKPAIAPERRYTPLLRPRLRTVSAAATAPTATNTHAQVVHAGYNCLGEANEDVKKKNGLIYIGTRMFNGMLYQLFPTPPV
jgi:hypothetical protein